MMIVINYRCYFTLSYTFSKMNVYYKTDENTWDSIVETCREHDIKLADIIIHSKYQINSERLFGFSEITQQGNINCGLILHNYECVQKTFSQSAPKPDIFTDDEWTYLLPQLQINNLLNKPLNFFYHIPDPLRMIEVYTATRKTCFFSNYYVRAVYQVNTSETPTELADLFINDGACLNAIYVRPYQRYYDN